MLALGWCACSSACADDTGLRVVVASDIEDLGSFEIAVWAGEVRRDDTLRSRRVFVIGEPDGVTLPASMGLVPRDGDSLRRVRIEVTGFTPRDAVTRAVTTGFVQGETREVRIDLLRRCEDVRCEQGLTCGADGCEPESRPAALLPRVGQPPRGSSDAAPSRDATAMDGGGRQDTGPTPDMAQPLDLAIDRDTGPTPSACPEGFDLIGESCYRALPGRSSWAEGEAECVRLGAHIVTIDGEDAELLGSIAGAAPWWTGLGPDTSTPGMPLSVLDVDEVLGLCATTRPTELVGEVVVRVDGTSARDNLASSEAPVCFPFFPPSGVPDVGFTLALPSRSLVVVRGEVLMASKGALVFPLDGTCTTPYAARDCAILGVGGNAAAFLREAGPMGVVVELLGGVVEVRVIGLRWASGIELAPTMPMPEVGSLASDSLPCVSFTRDERWRIEECERSQTVICERTPSGG